MYCIDSYEKICALQAMTLKKLWSYLDSRKGSCFLYSLNAKVRCKIAGNTFKFAIILYDERYT